MLAPVLVLGVMLRVSVPPQGMTGSDLFPYCQAWIRISDKTSSATEVIDSGLSEYCLGYIEGIATGLKYTKRVCFDSPTVGTLIRVYVVYMQQNPKLLDEEKYIGVLNALEASYPCRTRR